MKKILDAALMPILLTVALLMVISIAGFFVSTVVENRTLAEAAVHQLENSNSTLNDVAYLRLQPIQLGFRISLISVSAIGMLITGLRVWRAYKKSNEEEEA